MIRLCYQNDSRMVRWMFNFRPEDWISTEELRTKLKLNSMRGGLQGFGHPETMDDSAWSSKCRSFTVNCRIPWGRPRKTGNAVTRKVIKNIGKNRNAWEVYFDDIMFNVFSCFPQFINTSFQMLELFVQNLLLQT